MIYILFRYIVILFKQIIRKEKIFSCCSVLVCNSTKAVRIIYGIWIIFWTGNAKSSDQKTNRPYHIVNFINCFVQLSPDVSFAENIAIFFHSNHPFRHFYTEILKNSCDRFVITEWKLCDTVFGSYRELTVVQFRIEAAPSHKISVISLFYDVSVPHDEDRVTILDSWQSVRDNKARPAL